MPTREIGDARSETGFALIEVLVALIACSFVLTAYLATVGQSAKSTAMAGERSVAAAFAQSKLDVLGTVEPIENGETTGTFLDHYRWTLQISDDAVPASSGPYRPHRVVLEIRWSNGRRAQLVTFATVKLVRISGGGNAG